MAKRISVEFLYVDKTACSRCKKTWETVKRIVGRARKKLRGSGVKVSLKPRKINFSKISLSNSILIDGKDVEWTGKKRKTACKGCSEKINVPCECRAYVMKGKKYSHVPGQIIKKALEKKAKVKL